MFKAFVTSSQLLIGPLLLSPLLASYPSLSQADLLISVLLVESGAGAAHIVASIAVMQLEAAVLLSLARR